MMNTNIYKITAFVIFLNLLLHIALLHNIFSTSVICFDQDGNIKIENVEECNECSSKFLNFSLNENISNSNQDNCTDIILDVNCFNDNQIIQKQKKINQVNFIVDLLSSKIELNNNFKLKSRINKLFTINHPLSSYSTVSLLI